jgi:phosphoglycolate phosphatase
VKYKLVIFDFDGTLADSFPWALSVADQLADRHGIMRIDKSKIDSLRGSNMKNLLKEYKVPFWKLPFLVSDVRKLMTKGAGQIPLFAGIEQLLQRLAAQGTRLAVVTSNSTQNVQRVLGNDTAALIDYYECGVWLFGKRDKFWKILRKSGVSQAEVICIGDETRDIEAARSANLTCGAVTWGYARMDLLKAHGPDVIFTSVDELAQALL